MDLLATEGQQVTTVAGNLLRSWDAISAALIEEIQLDHTPVAGYVEFISKTEYCKAIFIHFIILF